MLHLCFKWIPPGRGPYILMRVDVDVDAGVGDDDVVVGGGGADIVVSCSC